LWRFFNDTFILSWIYFYFSNITPLGNKVHTRRFGHILNQAQVIQKTQKNVKPSHLVHGGGRSSAHGLYANGPGAAPT
jgi:hypothetical protein